MVRGTGKFKTKRGGGRNFSKHMVLDENGTAVSTDKRWAKRKDGEEGEDDEDASSEEEEEEEESSEEESPAGPSATQPELTRTERRELKKKQAAAKQAQAQGGDEDDEDADLINPNHVEKKLNISDLAAPRELTRKEREAKEKQEAKERYWKARLSSPHPILPRISQSFILTPSIQLHVAGKTEEAKSDLARLQKIRAEREAAQAKRKAEAEAKTAELEAKKKAAASGKRV
ncbi:hypothetical protein HYDPIDRAFT_190985 [Hydnomerulius pinastri MD-312]|uniref:Casein kinase substrate phosphoprotein PP28 domain-containing protein n=1 Tax=Hydnomerulius pinastri MD-312 TaxID=994086 RepID=A0A0C9VJX3_9AGAM|nr:hypothetical protein HYDPIDRAFT_190985 [Hydnomerulius pinastri MD-312]